MRRARDLIDPHGANRDSEADFDRRGLFLTRGMEGCVLGELELDAEDGDLLWAAIDSVLASERAAGNPVRPVDDPVDAAASTGEPRLTPAQRRADALMTLVRAGLERLEDQHPGRPRTEVLVLVDYDVLVHRVGGTARTASGVALTAEAVRRLCCDANLRRVVTRGGSEVLDLGTRTRSFTAAQRAALWARDQGCRFPGCGRWWGLHPHHIVHAADDGRTSTGNGCWLCRVHHRLVHEGGWTVTGDADATLLFHPPDGRPALASVPPAVAVAG